MIILAGTDNFDANQAIIPKQCMEVEMKKLAFVLLTVCFGCSSELTEEQAGALLLIHNADNNIVQCKLPYDMQPNIYDRLYHAEGFDWECANAMGKILVGLTQRDGARLSIATTAYSTITRGVFEYGCGVWYAGQIKSIVNEGNKATVTFNKRIVPDQKKIDIMAPCKTTTIELGDQEAIARASRLDNGKWRLVGIE